jgi:ribonucleoside-diphosphate reductase alpha chain
MPEEPPSLPSHALAAAPSDSAPEINATLSYTPQALARSAVMNEGLGTNDADNTRGHGSLDAHLDAMMGDAPVCDVCGHITVRNGACYKCLNCGNSMGCS